ncbi:MAG: hypothetical protein AABX13_02520 [Nanoarchaeota archaeon]
MKNARYVLWLLLVVLTASIAWGDFHTAGQIGFDPSSLSANAGDTVTLTVKAFPSIAGAKALDNKFNIVDLIINYDSSKLSFIGAARAGPLAAGSGWDTFTVTPGSGTVTIHAEVGAGDTAIKAPPNSDANTPAEVTTLTFTAASGASGSATVLIATTSYMKKTTTGTNGLNDFNSATLTITAAAQVVDCTASDWTFDNVAWNGCSAACGGGTQTRSAVKASGSTCTGEGGKPADETQACNTQDCEAVCTPTTCAVEGKNCGTISDGCGITLSCGTCSGGQTCGTDNTCGSQSAKALAKQDACTKINAATEGPSGWTAQWISDLAAKLKTIFS